ncbi:Nucleolar pre-ribosomal-associated protein 1 [Bienertia sinuspersici]
MVEPVKIPGDEGGEKFQCGNHDVWGISDGYGVISSGMVVLGKSGGFRWDRGWVRDFEGWALSGVGAARVATSGFWVVVGGGGCDGDFGWLPAIVNVILVDYRWWGGVEAIEDEVKIPSFEWKPSHEAKIRELLRNINSNELKLCSYGSKEFMKLLRGSSGGELLHEYVQASPQFTEILEVWNRRRGKPGLSYIMLLISVILGHSEGKYRPNDYGRIAISRVLDKFAKLIIEEKLDDIYKELNSKDGKRQKAALLLVASIVRRGSLLAAEVAKIFDFKLPVLSKLSEYSKKKMVKKRKHSTRDAFIEFALSFLEAGKPGLLRWILQQREIFSGILRGLGDDDEETVVYVLSTLRDRVLTHESLVPPGLRSVLFGSVTLEQLVGISAWTDGVLAAKLAHEVLLMVCIDPSNGLMPDLQRRPNALKGNTKRLVDLMKKLKATEIGYHRSLLLEIVNGRPSLASIYLDQFPYSLDDHTSSTWLSVVTLAANVVLSVRGGISWDFLDSQAVKLLVIEASDVQSVLKCICLRPFSRLVVNKGLLHSDFLIKHGTLRLLLEVLKLLSSFIDALSSKGLSSLKQKVQEEVLILLPDPQVLFTLLSSINSIYQMSGSALKRAADSESIESHKSVAKKKSKVNTVNEDIDILVGGLNSSVEIEVPEDNEKPRKSVTTFQFDNENSPEKILEIWSSYESSFSLDLVKNAEVYFCCKVLEALKIYHANMREEDGWMGGDSGVGHCGVEVTSSPLGCIIFNDLERRAFLLKGIFHAVLEVSYDFLKILPSNPLKLPDVLLQSLLSMLIEHLGCSKESGLLSTVLPPIYKHLQSFLNLSLYSPLQNVREQAYVLSKAAMMSTGAFDHNPCEIGSWFLFIHGDVRQYDSGKCQEDQLLLSLSSSVVSFLCDAVSTVGNNLVKYWDIMKCQCSTLETPKETDIGFSPLVGCVLEKCLRLLSSGSETFTLPEKSLVSLYVCNTLKHLLETQIDARVLAAVVHQFLSNRIENRIAAVADIEDSCSEWRPVISLFLFSRSILYQEMCNNCSTDGISQEKNSSFTHTLAEVQKLLSAGSMNIPGISRALCSTIACTNPTDIVDNLPSVLAVSAKLAGLSHSFMDYFYLDQNLMKRASKLWPNMFYTGLRISVIASSQVTQDDDKQTSLNALHYNSEKIDFSAVCFGSLLKEAPFHVLFPAITFCDLEHYSEIKELLVAKVSNLEIGQIVSSLRLVLFRFHWIQTAYRKKLSDQLELHSELCYLLVKHILSLLSTLKFGSGSSENNVVIPLSLCLQEVAKTIFCHPALTSVLLSPFDHDYHLTKEFLMDSSEGILRLSGEGMCKMELHVLNLLTTSTESLTDICSKELSSSMYIECKENIVKMLRNLVQWIFLIFKRRFKLWYKSGNMSLFPILRALVALMRFTSPIMLLELANWMLSSVELSDSVNLEISNVSPSCLAISIACGALSMLFQHIQSPNIGVVLRDSFWATELRSLDAKMTDNVKAKMLLLIVKTSALHSSVFGQLFSDILSEDTAPIINSAGEICNQWLSDEELLMLMPVAALYISVSWTKEQSLWNTKFMLTSYSRLLLEGFFSWKDFVSKTVFQVDYGNDFPCSVENLHDLFNNSLLQKAVHILKWYFVSVGNNKSKRLELLCSLCPFSGMDDFMDFEVSNTDSYSVWQLTNLINRAVARISLCLVLLFPEENKISPIKAFDVKGESFRDSNSEDSLKVRFLDVLVCIWQHVVKKFPSASDYLEPKTPICLLFRCLEIFTLRCIDILMMKMHSILIQMDSLPFVEKMAKVAFLHRFGDSTTLENIRHILSSLSDGNLPIVLILQLLLGHSQLASTVATVSDSSTLALSGMAVKPISSLLRSLNAPTERSNLENSERYKSQLQVIRLLRLLIHLRATRCGSVSEDDLGVNLGGLSLLLLTTYGATVSEVDLEIYSLLSEIGSAGKMGNKIFADLDYMWGSAIRVGKRHKMEHVPLNSDMEDVEEDCRRMQFRDNLPINPKLVIQTVLYFPYERTTCEKSLFLDNVHQDRVKNTLKAHLSEIGCTECYDPVFILSFSIHSLTMGFLDPLEFAGLGLLAIALVSMGSPVEGIRKLAYEVVSRFKDVLMRCQRKREVTRFKLLLTYLQNGIQEPWQKIPAVLAIFVAEASVVLLDPSHEHYPTISKFLLQSPRVNLKSIPLFHELFWSTSVNFRTDRLWMLRLLYAGINLEDDALICIRNSVLDILLSVYASPLTDIESKELILLVLKKCVTVPKTACYLVENCCLISWISSVLVLSIHTDDGDIFFSKQLQVLLEVVHETVSSSKIMEWLQEHAIEQLSDLLNHLLNLFVRCSKLALETKSLAILILQIIVTALKMSQERKLYQPLLTPSMRSLYQLHQAVDILDSDKPGDCAEYGLKALLMCAPPTSITDLDLEELFRFLTWAVSIAIRSDSQKALHQTQSLPHTCTLVEEHIQEEPLTSTLLRWLVASVILQRVSFSNVAINSSFFSRRTGRTLLSLIENLESRGEEHRLVSGSEEILASTIFHLQQLLGMKCQVLPSVVAALSVLLLADGPYATEGDLSGDATCTSLQNSASSLWSKICCPPEANPSWRWSFYQPWADQALELTDLEKLNESHACQKLLVIISRVLSKNSSEYELLSTKDLESSGLFEWERTNLQHA